MGYLESPLDLIAMFCVFASNGIPVSLVVEKGYRPGKAALFGALWGFMSILFLVLYAYVRPWIIDGAEFTLIRPDLEFWHYMLIIALVCGASSLSCHTASSKVQASHE